MHFYTSEKESLQSKTFVKDFDKKKGIGDGGSTADIGMLWSAIVCLGLGLL